MSSSAEGLQRELEAYATGNGIDLFGVAELAPARDFITRFGGAFLGGFPRAIALAAKKADGVVERLPHRNDPDEHRTIFLTYRAHSENLGERLARVATDMVDIIERSRYQAFPVFRGKGHDKQLAGVMSQKIAPHLAGLGWIGKNCLVVNPNLGPRLALLTLLTDAPLTPGRPLEDGCGDCRLCVDICPAQAFTGASFDPAQPREARYNAHLCEEYNLGQLKRLGIGNRFAPGHACGLCLYVCPYGKKGTATG
ncbi:MAG: epoxyqueuosine reductase [Chloroflexi bacterium]|nr:epoxyqueuosine reductase [Chloroflexota bacterium]